MKRLLGALAIVLVTASCSGDTRPGSTWKHLADIDYLLPGELPRGWVLSYATERPGRPFDDWENHAELYANDDEDEFVFLSAAKARNGKATKPSRPSRDTEATPEYAIVYLTGGIDSKEELTALESHWRSSTLVLGVMHFAADPDPALVQRVAKQFEHEEGLGFRPPDIGGGFRPVGAIGEEVTDYTMVFTPKRYAGASRGEAIQVDDDAPSASVNVGAIFYGQRTDLKSLADAKIVKEKSGRLRLEFVRDGMSVNVASDALDRNELRALAESLRAVDYADWQQRWGSRLLTQDPPDSPS